MLAAPLPFLSIPPQTFAPPAQVRFARPTDRLPELARFYEEGLGMRRLGSFQDHAGYDGLMLGFPGASWHLEFTHHRKGSPGPAPSREHLLVLYYPDRASAEAAARRVRAQGWPQVEAENPYWKGRSLVVRDPEGWEVVLFFGPWMPQAGVPAGGTK